MRPPSLADFIYARVCKLICERSLTLPFLDCVYALSNLSSAFLLLITLPNRTLPAQPPVRLYPCLQTAAVLGYTPALEMLYILGANFRLFLRFKGPASKGTRIYPHDRLQGPPFKKMRCRTAAPVLTLLTSKDLLRPLILRLPSRPFYPHPTPPACPTHPWPRKTAPTVSMLSAAGRPPESEASV